MRVTRRWVTSVVVVVVAVVASSLGCSSDGDRADGAATAAAADPEGGGAPIDLAVDFEAVGLQLVPSISATFAGLAYTPWQVSTMQLGVDGGQGLTGSELDAALPVPEGAPPLSYFIGAWIARGGTPASSLARDVVGEQDWTRSPDVVFPDAVLALFVHDAFGGSSESSADAISLETRSPRHGRQALVADGAPTCLAIQGFFERTMSSLFEAIKLSPDFLGKTGPAGAIGSFLSGLFNLAVDFARGVIGGLVSAITQPIVRVLSFAVTALAIIAELGSFIKGWRATLAPNRNQPYVTGTEPDVGDSGRFRLHVESLAAKWPKELTGCAESLGVAFPKGVEPGTKVAWTVPASAGATYSVIDDPLAGALGSDETALLRFHAVGQPSAVKQSARSTRDPLVVRARVDVDAFKEVRRIAEAQIAGLRSAIVGRLAGIPGVSDIVATVIGPVERLLQSATSGFGMVGLSASADATIQYSIPDDPSASSSTTTTTSTPADPSAFCSAYADYELEYVLDGSKHTLTEKLEAHKRLRDTARPPSEIVDTFNWLMGSLDSAAAGAVGQGTVPDAATATAKLIELYRWLKARCPAASLHGYPIDLVLQSLEAGAGG